MNWLFYSIASTIGFAGITLLIKKLTLFGIKSEVLNFYFWALTTFVFFIYILAKKSPFAVSGKSWIWFILLAAVAFVTNLFYVYAIDLAPNPGYVRALQAAQIMIVAIVSYFIFGSKLDIRAFIGIIAIFIGIYLISTS